MRNLRPLFEAYVQTDDVQTRRALRSTTAAIRQESDDAFEDYLRLMSRPGTYGGEPELVAFCQAYDQDVTVHLPRLRYFDRDSINYTNEHRDTQSPQPTLHICYGGNEETRAHYDSARNRDGSHPRSHNSPMLEPQDSRRGSMAGVLSSSPTHNLTARAIRNSRSDLSSELIHDLLQKGRKDMGDSLDVLNHRARSASVSSSHRSSSSKRSLEDDGENPRRSKKADRRRSTRKRTDLAMVSVDPDTEISFRLQIESPHPATPTSTQDTENSSEPLEPEPSENDDAEFNPSHYDEESDSDITRPQRRMLKPASRTGVNILPNRAPSSGTTNLVTMAERPRSTLRT